MATFLPIRDTKVAIDNTPIVDGQFLMTTDLEGGNSLQIDIGTSRKLVVPERVDQKIEETGMKIDELEGYLDGFELQLAEKANQTDLASEVTNRTNAVLTEKTERQAEIAVERSRINSFTSLTAGSTTGDAELIDGRVGADEKTYTNIGGAIRGQVNNLTNKIVANTNMILNPNNSVKLPLFDKTKESWGETDGTWYYNWDAATVRNIIRVYDTTISKLPLLRINISNASGVSKWVGSQLNTLANTNYYCKIRYYIETSPSLFKVNVCDTDIFGGSLDTTPGWHEYKKAFTPININNKIFRIYTTGNVNVYIEPIEFVAIGLVGGVYASDMAIVGVRANEKSALEVLSPNRIYNVANNRTANHTTGYQDRQYTTPMFTDYLVNKKTDITFDNGSDKHIFTSLVDDYGTYNNGNNVLSRDITVPIESEDYNVSDLTVKQITTKSSVTSGQKMFVLTIGDSQTEEGLAQSGQYWRQCADLFKREDMDFWRSGDSVQFLGTKKYQNVTISNYQSQTKSYTACCEGRAGWMLADYLRHAEHLPMTKESFIKLFGTSEAWTGSDTQKNAIASTNQSFAGTPENPFFDNALPTRFSILKWIERYRTLDDNGNPLTLGNGTGTLITSDNIDTIKVCTPTHIFIRLGQNDFGNYSINDYRNNVIALISRIRAQLPNVYIIIGLALPSMGTWHPERYPDWIDLPTPAQSYWYDNAKYWSNYFKTYDQETNKVFLLEDYYFTPVTDGFYCYTYSDGEISGNPKLQQYIGTNYYKKPYGTGFAIHPNEKANFLEGYHLYSLLKYTQTIV